MKRCNGVWKSLDKLDGIVLIITGIIKENGNKKMNFYAKREARA